MNDYQVLISAFKVLNLTNTIYITYKCTKYVKRDIKIMSIFKIIEFHRPQP